MMNPYMHEALTLAEQGRYSCAPNPMVGCVIVNRGQVVGRGWHQRAGEPHAEIVALHEAGTLAAGAEIYVNLEPCCHEGRTGSCVAALIAAKVSCVHLAVVDPNPLVAGQGLAQLRAAGIAVHIGCCADEALALNQIFFHYITQKQPFVMAKWAMSLDGKISVPSGQSRQLTSTAALEHSHRLRQAVAAILVGANTAITDDPQLTVRRKDLNLDPNLQPWRIILSAKGDLPHHLHLFNSPLASKTLVYTTEHSLPSWRQRIESQGVSVIIAPTTEEGMTDLLFVLKDLGEKHISSLLVEGGSRILTSFYRQALLQKIIIYLAPKFIGHTEALSPLRSLDLISEQSWQIEEMLFLAPDVCLTLKKVEKKICLPV
ncbi:MAG: ribD [Gammaproteobacteria bacterium]|jgi:diaminohydroxyphosphoribosylaminopyrimidine deaminase/5-amino-6-(5-phosphoribosylamino)uracil reductase|nr:ribD [Gammaproteobacteria bacterium]